MGNNPYPPVFMVGTYAWTQLYKGVRQFYHTRYHATKINIVNKLRTVSRKLEVFLGEENMLRAVLSNQNHARTTRHRGAHIFPIFFDS